MSTSRWLQISTFDSIQIQTRIINQNVYYRSAIRPVWGEISGFAKFGLKNGLPFGIDAAWQLASDWNTPMPWHHRAGRVGVAVGVGAVSGYVVVAGLGAIVGATPPGWLVIGVGVVVGVTVEPYVRDWLFEQTGLVSTKEEIYN